MDPKGQVAKISPGRFLIVDLASSFAAVERVPVGADWAGVRAEWPLESGRRSLVPVIAEADHQSMNGAELIVRYPGLPAVVDGSEAVAHVETRISQAACSYPITPSTTMAAIYQAAVADGQANLWGTPLVFIEPESEHWPARA